MVLLIQVPLKHKPLPANGFMVGGGGGGLVALGDETIDFRMKSSRVKADQVKKTEAKILATACENCHSQLGDLNDHYKMNVEVKFLSSMIADALVPNN